MVPCYTANSPHILSPQSWTADSEECLNSCHPVKHIYLMLNTILQFPPVQSNNVKNKLETKQSNKLVKHLFQTSQSLSTLFSKGSIPSRPFDAHWVTHTGSCAPHPHSSVQALLWRGPVDSCCTQGLKLQCTLCQKESSRGCLEQKKTSFLGFSLIHKW